MGLEGVLNDLGRLKLRMFNYMHESVLIGTLKAHQSFVHNVFMCLLCVVGRLKYEPGFRFNKSVASKKKKQPPPFADGRARILNLQSRSPLHQSKHDRPFHFRSPNYCPSPVETIVLPKYYRSSFRPNSSPPNLQRSPTAARDQKARGPGRPFGSNAKSAADSHSRPRAIAGARTKIGYRPNCAKLRPKMTATIENIAHLNFQIEKKPGIS
jgi:hypothetical protein